MGIEDVLRRLKKVRQTGRGWMALCPAHEDREPSLSIAKGERAVLIHCFAGCLIQEIVRALGIDVRDLFFDSDSGGTFKTFSVARKRKDEENSSDAGVVLDVMREAEYLLRTARHIDISAWNVGELEAALNAVAAAYWIMELDSNALDY